MPLQELPFQNARPFAGWPPAVLKGPPTRRSPFGSTTIALQEPPRVPMSPVPRDCQVEVESVQRAMPLTCTPLPMLTLKLPPATRSPLGMLASAKTKPVCGLVTDPICRPVFRLDHDAPSHLAMLLQATPPALMKLPPAIRSPLGRTSSDWTGPSMPDPRGLQELPVRRATWLAGAPSMLVNQPATTRSPFGIVTAASIG